MDVRKIKDARKDVKKNKALIYMHMEFKGACKIHKNTDIQGSALGVTIIFIGNELRKPGSNLVQSSLHFTLH